MAKTHFNYNTSTVTMCGLRVGYNEFRITNAEEIVTCKRCLTIKEIRERGGWCWLKKEKGTEKELLGKMNVVKMFLEVQLRNVNKEIRKLRCGGG